MIEIYDTTLRDGTQRKDISLSCNDKIAIAKRLDDLGVAYIEGGWPGSNPKDVEFFERAARIQWKNAKIAAFGSTCQANKNPADDPNIQASAQIRNWNLHHFWKNIHSACQGSPANHPA